MMFNYYGPGWSLGRADVYSWLANNEQSELDEIQVELRDLKAGWIRMDIYLNGVLKHTISLSYISDPTHDIIRWLENIVDDTKLLSAVEIDEEGCSSTLVFEHLQRAEFGIGKAKSVIQETIRDQFWSPNDLYDMTESGWMRFDAFNHFDYGLIYLYDSDSDRIKFKAIVKTRDLINTIYMSFLTFAYKFRENLFDEWCYFNNDLDAGGEVNQSDVWQFYNSLKSPIIEWNINSDKAFRHVKPKFKELAKIDCVIHMWPEWGDALFWDNGCCGNADSVYVNGVKYDLTCIKGLREWYDDMDINALGKWSNEDWKAHSVKGLGFAKEIRKILPENVDLYYRWLSYKDEFKGEQFPFRLVP